MKKALIAGLVLALALAGVKVGYEAYKLTQPRLVGHCYVSGGMGLAIMDAAELTNPETGEKIKVYRAMVLTEQGAFPMPLDIKKANREIPKNIADKKMAEVNCETGQPIESK